MSGTLRLISVDLPSEWKFDWTIPLEERSSTPVLDELVALKTVHRAGIGATLVQHGSHSLT